MTVAASPGTTACRECGVGNAADHNYCKHCGTALRVASIEQQLATSPAERMYERSRALVEAYPDNATAHFNLGSACYHLGQLGNAIRAFERAIQLDDTMPAAHFQLALASFHLGRLDEAVHAFEATIAADPEYVIAWYHLGIIRERQDDYERAIDCFERVVQANPDDASAHYHLGLCYEHLGLDACAMSARARPAARSVRRSGGGGAAGAPALIGAPAGRPHGVCAVA